jgi:hypothetical protein
MKEVLEQVIELVRYYSLWWFFMEKSNTIRYDKTERNYPDFFITIADSLRCSFFVTAYRLFDKRTGVNSFVTMIAATSDKTLAASLQAKIDAIAPIIEKIRKLRHNVMAHRNKSQPPEQWFAVADITPAEMKQAVITAKEIICAAIDPKDKEATERQFQSLEDAVTTDAFNLMRHLGEPLEPDMSQAHTAGFSFNSSSNNSE